MTNLFRRIRKKMADDNKPMKYTRYALGEIALVVIGILIALQINNWNEERKERRKISNTLLTVKENLEGDLPLLEKTIKFYESKDSLFEIILSDDFPNTNLDTITSANYENCNTCRSNINRFRSFEYNDKGYNLLKEFESNTEFVTDTVTIRIIRFYNAMGPRIKKLNIILGDFSLANYKFFEQFPWYINYNKGLYNAESVKFFHTNERYRKKVSSYRIISTRNYLNLLKNFKNESMALIEIIEGLEEK